MSNTVGSLEVPMMLHARKKLTLALSSTQKDILIGCILGDAYITKLGKIRIEHSIRQREYVEWKWQALGSLCYNNSGRDVAHTYNGKIYIAVFFLLRQYFRAWRAIFYKGKEKVFPKNLHLTPLSLAVWYMDDGCWTGKKILISTESFGKESMQNIQSVLHEQFAIETIASSNGKLVIRKKSHKVFSDTIAPYIIPAMKYKLPNPVTTQSEIVIGVTRNRVANTLAPHRSMSGRMKV